MFFSIAGFIPIVGKLVAVHPKGGSPGYAHLLDQGVIDVENAVITADQHDVFMKERIDGSLVKGFGPGKLVSGILQKLVYRDELPQQLCPCTVNQVYVLPFLLQDHLGNAFVTGEIDDQVNILPKEDLS